MNRGAWILILLLGGTAGLAQDLESLKNDLKQGIAALDRSKVRDALEAIGRLDSAPAVDAVTTALGWAARVEQDLQRQHEELAEKERKARQDFEKAQDVVTKANAQSAWIQANQDLRNFGSKLKDIAEIRDIIAAALSKFSGDKGWPALLSKLRSSPDAVVRQAVARAIERIEREGALEVLLEQLRREKEPGVKVALIDAIRSKKDKSRKVIDALCAELKSDWWQVQAAAIAALRALKAREAIEPLIEAFRTADGRIKGDLQDALMALTGVDKGSSAEAWKSWFEQHREAVLAGTYKPRDDEKPSGQGGAATAFFGIPVRSKRVVFVLDRSGSMAQKADFELEIDTGTPGNGSGGEVKPQGDRKIDIARYQLKKVLSQLPDGVRFNIIYYNQAFEVFKPDLIKLSKETRKEAFDYIDRTDPQGATNIFDSLERALQFALGPDGRLRKDGADTVYLLSDGLPNQGKFTQPDDIIREIKRLNSAAKVQINTVYIPESGPGLPGGIGGDLAGGEKLMKQLAADSGGTMVILKKKSPKK